MLVVGSIVYQQSIDPTIVVVVVVVVVMEELEVVIAISMMCWVSLSSQVSVCYALDLVHGK